LFGERRDRNHIPFSEREAAFYIWGIVCSTISAWSVVTGWLLCGRLAIFLCGIRQQAEQHIEDECRLLSKKIDRRRDMFWHFWKGKRKSWIDWS